MNLKDSIHAKQQDFVVLCKSHEVKTLYAFGSSVTNRFNEQTSDFDFLVELNTTDPLKRGEYLFDLWEKLELLFQRKVDLLTNASVRNPILRKSIDSSKL